MALTTIELNHRLFVHLMLGRKNKFMVIARLGRGRGSSVLGEMVLGSKPAVAAGSLLIGSVSV